jgi:hypothetical protein
LVTSSGWRGATPIAAVTGQPQPTRWREPGQPPQAGQVGGQPPATGNVERSNYELGHGYCSYSFFEQCPHRMACTRCDFYLPKQSSEAQLLEPSDGLQRKLVEIPLNDDERAAVEGYQNAIDRRSTSSPTSPPRRDRHRAN